MPHRSAQPAGLGDQPETLHGRMTGDPSVSTRIDDGTNARQPTSQPGPARLGAQLAAMSPAERLVEAMRRAVPLLPGDLRGEFLQLLSPANLAVTTLVLGLWAGSHAFGVGEVIDVLLLVAGALTLGMAVFTAARDLALFVQIGASARTDAELDAAAHHLARFVSVVGVATFVAVIMKVGGRSIPRRLSGPVGEAEGLGAAPRKSASDAWWEASDFEPNFPGTTVPRAFRLRVAGRTFRIKGRVDPIKGNQGATKHMEEYASLHGTARLRSGEVDYPISPLAAALEQVERSGDLAPLLQGRVKRLGTKDAPYSKGGWELSFEYVNGEVEVLHAVPKGP